MSELDDPVGASLHGAHAGLARRTGRVATYPADVATFCAVPADPGPDDWADLAALVGPGGLADLFTAPGTPPADWDPVFAMPGRQLVAPAPTGDVDPRVVELGRDDDAAMLDLATRTRPGPFFTRTARLGTFLGVRDGDALVAMAGQRLHPGGWVEISAVCTDERARGRGLAAVLVAAQVARTAADGGRAFLHVVDTNAGARALYARLGFTERRPVVFRGFRVPG
ncbi:GNAT family N-acetyltransferase [Klenkia taihuensis]|uniref:Predicted acetyltransferase, GNAT family n=1 Tax=Klenkia taihuensis TaxID=1225127 RepID=A0A1I1IM72_9ACTN|nr:GNAT family N-acetyltransferase [Klenkia taihuensis]GHE08532.1 GNAT family N-acetyltransferase [Klenkia taihuensis]SFC37031.1 Predicted acetyltransferase, GNAT family [Klenkia taihuensis]